MPTTSQPSKQPIDFYFDFSSPYGYLAATKIDALAAAHGREVAWRPILLGPAFKASGNAPLIGQPLKGEYSIRDFKRSAKFLKVPFNMPAPFPIATQNAARAFYWLHDTSPLQAKALAMALFKTYFVEGRDITASEVVVEVATTLRAKNVALLHVGLAAQVERLTISSSAASESEPAATRGSTASKAMVGRLFLLRAGLSAAPRLASQRPPSPTHP